MLGKPTIVNQRDREIRGFVAVAGDQKPLSVLVVTIILFALLRFLAGKL
jgi:hypothetical protein